MNLYVSLPSFFLSKFLVAVWKVTDEPAALLLVNMSVFFKTGLGSKPLVAVGTRVRPVIRVKPRMTSKRFKILEIFAAARKFARVRTPPTRSSSCVTFPVLEQMTKLFKLLVAVRKTALGHLLGWNNQQQQQH